VEEQNGAEWRGSSPLAGAQLVLNHSEWSSAFHSQLTSGLCVCLWGEGVVRGVGAPPPPPSPSHPACRCVICSQREWWWWWWGRGRGLWFLNVTCQRHECMQTAVARRAKAGAGLPSGAG